MDTKAYVNVGRRVDAFQQACKPAWRHGFQARRRGLSAGGGRSVDVKAKAVATTADRKGLISSDFSEPMPTSSRTILLHGKPGTALSGNDVFMTASSWSATCRSLPGRRPLACALRESSSAR